MGKPLVLGLDYGSTLTSPATPYDPVLRMRPIDPRAAETLKYLHGTGRFRLGLVSNTRPGQDRLLALERAGVLDLFEVVLESSKEGVAKPHPAFYRRFLDRVGAAPNDIWFVGDHPVNDVVAPLQHRMGAVLVRQPEQPVNRYTSLPPALENEVPIISHISELIPLVLAA
ncbi:HAD family hydrolase [Streptosporangium sp. NPDC020072]|uniref:HAD family hydrolase n=1 Tax=Streptosporangium sp. NPDC020072 TaxID=3154788 RepID=UPI00341AF54E